MRAPTNAWKSNKSMATYIKIRDHCCENNSSKRETHAQMKQRVWTHLNLFGEKVTIYIICNFKADKTEKKFIITRNMARSIIAQEKFAKVVIRNSLSHENLRQRFKQEGSLYWQKRSNKNVLHLIANRLRFQTFVVNLWIIPWIAIAKKSILEFKSFWKMRTHVDVQAIFATSGL